MVKVVVMFILVLGLSGRENVCCFGTVWILSNLLNTLLRFHLQMRLAHNEFVFQFVEQMDNKNNPKISHGIT